MLVRPKLAGPFVALVFGVVLFFSGCSSRKPRDLQYGTDADLFYVPPDAPPATDAGTIDAESAVDSDKALDSDHTVDGGAALDAPIDTPIDTSVDMSVDGDD
jgi:hypothetical protein